ncbi:MAG: UDP-N-acetylmuramate:L-alanyl-gamma-D-glutamyl-meso-diaminopimelate ligase [Acidobacteria bacterium]|nr:UDP-N-acetylmuramate:L-alanyl-gamma-D-glutamyl-meso-diaminopimelate ligase [Acidobacteriota bacterium]
MHYHLIGIGGTAMASLAGLLLAKGCKVTGSDENLYPPMSIELEKLGIPVFTGYRAEHLAPVPDVVVVGNALSRGNPEIEAMLNARMTYTSMARVLEEQFLRGRRPIVISGTHGKTTTTSLMAWVMECAGLNPSFLIGGVAENFGSSYRLTESPWFVIEGDEYDTAYFDKGPKFMHYLPEVVILNAVEFDHGDIYADLKAVLTAFQRLVNLIPSDGFLAADFDSNHSHELTARAFCPVEGFGLSEHAHWRALDVHSGEKETSLTIMRAGETWQRIRTPLSGAFNIRNALGVVAAATHLGVSQEAITGALAGFKSVKRRMEVIGEPKGITLIDDFAHHPTAVRETLRALRAKYPGRRLIAVYEPRSQTSRMRIFQEEYPKAFDEASLVVLAPVFRPPSRDADMQLSVEELVASLARQGTKAVSPPGVEAIVEYVASEARPGDVIAIMSNGAFGGIHQKLLAALD